MSEDKSTDQPHKAGFVSIVGKPNVGKSTLMNKMLGARLAITTSKAQTTRHRIMGILNGDDYQIVYSDTPGVIKPKYALHTSMMDFVKDSFEDADLVLFVTDIFEEFDEQDVIDMIKDLNVPVFLLINKIDQADQDTVEKKAEEWKGRVNVDEIMAVSAAHNFNTKGVLKRVLDFLPEHPPYFDKEQISDKPEKFFAAEMIREKILMNYKQEVPYSCEVYLEEFKESDKLIRMSAVICVERDSQKAILIGSKGEKLKKIGIQARKELEAFFDKQVHLEQRVEVEENWKSNKKKLKAFGYFE